MIADKNLVIDATIRDWQLAGDHRSADDIWPEAEVYVDAYQETFDKLVTKWTAEGMDNFDAKEEARAYATDAAREALKEFTTTD